MTSTAVIAHEVRFVVVVVAVFCCRVGVLFCFEFQVLVSFSHLANYSTTQLFSSIHSWAMQLLLFCSPAPRHLAASIYPHI